jgi:hypothetical protein
MLEMTNKQLIEHWLSLRKPEDVAAGVFFDVDKLSVLTRDGVVEPLYSSPFSQRLHECIIYLDDAHTRGTDLKLPLNFRAMVTLGPKVTKDRLVQGMLLGWHYSWSTDAVKTSRLHADAEARSRPIRCLLCSSGH